MSSTTGLRRLRPQCREHYPPVDDEKNSECRNTTLTSNKDGKCFKCRDTSGAGKLQDVRLDNSLKTGV